MQMKNLSNNFLKVLLLHFHRFEHHTLGLQMRRQRLSDFMSRTPKRTPNE